MSIKRTVGTMACAAAVLACALPGTVIRAGAYACADVARAVSLDGIPDGYEADGNGVGYVLGARTVEVVSLDEIPDGYEDGDGGIEYVIVPHGRERTVAADAQ